MYHSNSSSSSSSTSNSISRSSSTEVALLDGSLWTLADTVKFARDFSIVPALMTGAQWVQLTADVLAWDGSASSSGAITGNSRGGSSGVHTPQVLIRKDGSAVPSPSGCVPSGGVVTLSFPVFLELLARLGIVAFFAGATTTSAVAASSGVDLQLCALTVLQFIDVNAGRSNPKLKSLGLRFSSRTRFL